ncbi:draxin [Spea bombifrons]|uniref:draxin n=1 Tax=Spea bombifrons TaxID=233779 RepID=UPI00234B667B|nr:draxin [Spea bombifrons]
MASFSRRHFCFCLVLVVITNHLSFVNTLDPKVKPKRTSEANNYESWVHQPQERPHRRPGMSKKDRTLGGPSPTAFVPAEGGNGSPPQWGAAEALPPSALKQGREEFQSFDFPYNQRNNQPPGAQSKGKKHNREHKRSNNKDRGRHHRGRSFEAEPSGLLKEDLSFKMATHLSHVGVSPSAPGPAYPLSTAHPMAVNGKPTAALETSHRTRPQSKKGGDVTPTLDMGLFDWTDYEDMKPDTWPSPKKKGKQKVNVTEEEPCDHHLDCLPGSCCDLREHLCKPHNRGLNNKCYDDCMCTEGLRCYAKFHRNQRVTRKKGRCVDPESINKDQGSFISV